MAKISTYPSAESPLLLSDRLIGTEAVRLIPSSTPLATKNFSLGELLQLFSSNFPAASLQAVLNTGNTATQNITLTGTIDVTLIKPGNIIDVTGSQGNTFQFLSKATSSLNWVDLPVDNLQAVLDSGNIATKNIILNGDITSTNIKPRNIKDETSAIGTTGQVLLKTSTGIRWSNNPTVSTPGLADVLFVGNTAINNINLIGNITATSFIKQGGTSLEFLMADGSVLNGLNLDGLTDVSIMVPRFNNDILAWDAAASLWKNKQILIGDADFANDNNTYNSTLLENSFATFSDLSFKQNTLVSGTNIKTINGASILGSGNLVISGGSITLSAIGNTPNANAATITGNVLNLQPASVNFGGVITIGAQTIAGIKTFQSSPVAPTPTASNNSTAVATTEYVDRQVGLGNPVYNILITTAVNITTETNGTSGGLSYSQNGRNVMINNGASAITVAATVASTATDFIASYTKVGSATITFTFTGTGATIVQPNGLVLSGTPGSTALLTKNGTTLYVLINNLQ